MRESENLTRLGSKTTEYSMTYDPSVLDRSVVNEDQIRKVLMAYKKAIYEELYPDREKKWEYIPKTLIFAKDDNHATQIVEVAKQVFGEEFEDVFESAVKSNIEKGLLERKERTLRLTRSGLDLANVVIEDFL